MTYNGRRGPNVSEYIANLNAIPSPQDMHNQDNLNFEDDLALFTNTQFFDFDHQQDLDLQQTFDGAHAAGDAAALDMKALDFAQGKQNLFLYSTPIDRLLGARPCYYALLVSLSMSSFFYGQAAVRDHEEVFGDQLNGITTHHPSRLPPPLSICIFTRPFSTKCDLWRRVPPTP